MKQGLLNVQNLEGSIFKWANEGKKIITEDNETHIQKVTKKVHPYNFMWSLALNSDLRSYTKD